MKDKHKTPAVVMAVTIATVAAGLLLATLRADAAPTIPSGDAYDNCQEDVPHVLVLDSGCYEPLNQRIRIWSCLDSGDGYHTWSDIKPCDAPMCDQGYTAESGCFLCHPHGYNPQFLPLISK